MSNITILKVEKEKAPKGYIITNVSYKTADGKVKGMKVFPFKEQADVAAAFADAKPGDVYEAAFRKNDKDFWEFAPTPTKTGATEKEVSTANGSSGGTTRSNWETTAERAEKQVRIARQSSLQRTLEFFELTGNKKPALEDVLKVTEVFVNYVQNGVSKTQQTGDVE